MKTFKHKRTIRLVYERHGGKWVLKKAKMDRDLAKHIGWRVLQQPDSPEPHVVHVKNIHHALGQAKLDGGGTTEVLDEKTYRIEFSAEPKKPKHSG